METSLVRIHLNSLKSSVQNRWFWSDGDNHVHAHCLWMDFGGGGSSKAAVGSQTTFRGKHMGFVLIRRLNHLRLAPIDTSDQTLDCSLCELLIFKGEPRHSRGHSFQLFESTIFLLLTTQSSRMWLKVERLVKKKVQASLQCDGSVLYYQPVRVTVGDIGLFCFFKCSFCSHPAFPS